MKGEALTVHDVHDFGIRTSLTSDSEHDDEGGEKKSSDQWRRSSSAGGIKTVRKAAKTMWSRGKLPRPKPSGDVKVHKLNEMGQIVDKKGQRAWEMACGLQMGMRVMVSMNNHAVSKNTAPDFECFQESVKLKFPTGGSSLTPPHQGPSFTFKDYAPHVFRSLRSVFGIDNADYMVALCNTQRDGSNALRIMGALSSLALRLYLASLRIPPSRLPPALSCLPPLGLQQSPRASHPATLPP